MTKKNDYNRIIALGSWLERFLDYPWSQYEIEQLADEALNLLNIDYVRKDDDFFINNTLKVIGGAPSDIAPPGCDDSERKLINFDLTAMIHYVFFVLESLSALEKYKDLPWEMAILKEPCDNDPDSNPLDWLVSRYNDIREYLVIKDKKVMIINKMVFADTKPLAEALQWVRFPALVSHIFINFLTVGGRDYCSFCRHCGKFILAERKGRRQFCGGRCRIAYKRSKDKREELS